MSITIIRKKDKKKNFSIILNEVFERSDMSARAKGVYAYLLTRPDDWEIIKTHLYKQFSDGNRGIDSAIKELEGKGYITKRRKKNEKSRFTGWEYTVFESISDAPSDYEDTVSPESPISESRNTELSEFRTSKYDPLLNTDYIPNTNNQKYIGILEHWNAMPALPSHTEKIFGKHFGKSHREEADAYGIDTVLKAIENYNAVLASPDHYFTHKWTLWDFIKRGLSKFIDAMHPLENYRNRRAECSTEPIHNTVVDWRDEA